MISDILGFSMEAHGDPMGTPWGPMGTHGNPWEPMGTHGFSMDFTLIFGEAAGAADKKCGGGGSPPHESLGTAL